MLSRCPCSDRGSDIPCDSLLFICISVLKAFYLTGLTSEQSMQTGQLDRLQKDGAQDRQMFACRESRAGKPGGVLWSDFVSTGGISGMALSTSCLDTVQYRMTKPMMAAPRLPLPRRTLNNPAPFLESPGANPMAQLTSRNRYKRKESCVPSDHGLCRIPSFALCRRWLFFIFYFILYSR